MPRHDIIFRNPLRLLGGEPTTILPPGGFGAISSRAGVGKTALLVQIALERMLHNQDVVHLSLEDPLDKVKLWYKQVLNGLCLLYQKPLVEDMWTQAAPHRLIMTFNVEEFTVPKFEERLTDMVEQNIISPTTLLVDGLDFVNQNPATHLFTLKELALKYKLRVWFTVRTHRHEDSNYDGMPAPLMPIEDLFDTIIDLQSTKSDILVSLLKCATGTEDKKELVLHPPTMLVKNRYDD